MDAVVPQDSACCPDAATDNPAQGAPESGMSEGSFLTPDTATEPRAKLTPRCRSDPKLRSLPRRRKSLG